MESTIALYIAVPSDITLFITSTIDGTNDTYPLVWIFNIASIPLNSIPSSEQHNPVEIEISFKHLTQVWCKPHLALMEVNLEHENCLSCHWKVTISSKIRKLSYISSYREFSQENDILHIVIFSDFTSFDGIIDASSYYWMYLNIN